MPLNSEISSALQLLEHIQETIKESEDVKLQAQTSEDLNLLISLLDNPIFHSVATIQDSLNELSYQIQKHPSILPVDFDLTAGGELVLKLPSPAVYEEEEEEGLGVHHHQPPPPPPPLNSSVGTNSARLREWEESEEGRTVLGVKLFKPDDRSLGFSIVSLRSMEKGEIGIFIQEIQGEGIAGKDGRLKKGDQILSIDGQPVGANISHQQAILLLQKARGNVELIVARASALGVAPSPPASPSPTGLSEISDPSEEVAFNTEWGQVEVIDLVNDGCGLGFGITGDGRSGVVVKTLLPGGVADRDSRLKSGDHILQIGDVYLQGMGSEQVVEVLRQAGSRVRLVVNRPIQVSGAPLTPQLPIRNQEYIEPDEGLDLNDSPCVLHESTPGMTTSHSSHSMYQEDFEIEEVVEEQICDIQKIENPTPPRKQSVPTPPRKHSMNDLFFLETQEPEMERFTVELKKDIRGLGITIAGYVCEKEELSGIFVKNISAGSVADLCEKIQVNDRIVEVDGQSLHGFTNHEAVEVLRSTGGTVRLTLERYLRGPKFQELQQAIANSELKPNTPPSPSTISLPCFPSGNETETPENSPLPMSFSVLIPQINTMSVEDDDVELLIDTDYEGVLKPTVEEAIKKKWRKVMGPDVDIVVGQLKKLNGGGLGISLEGTIDTENNREIRRHHYIRSILPDGPVGKNGKLKSGDELLEVNGHRLFGMSHIEVVNILKELPLGVRMVCARHRDITPIQMLERFQPEHTLQVNAGLLEGNLQNLMPVTDRLVKAKSDGCLASTATSEPNLGKHRSKSLEPIAGLAMWSSEPHVIELVKGEHGLGFSILDYQDPLNPNETVIVIRSLVPGGVAQADGRLIPGDRLLAVNSVVLDNASLDQAVQALKGAPKGIVRIVVAKPLPITETAP